MARTVEQPRDILTPDQAAGYLQLDRETVYRYIREGKLMASRLGRSYRIPRSSIETLLWATRTRADIVLRDYSSQQIERFLEADTLDPEAETVVRRFREGDDAK